jgi:hypothetical protein
MSTDAYTNALEKLRAGYAPYPQLCMDFLEGLGYSVEALGNEEQRLRKPTTMQTNSQL